MPAIGSETHPRVSTTLRTNNLYPKIEPDDKGFLKVSEIHLLYYEQSGNPEGNSVVYCMVAPEVERVHGIEDISILKLTGLFFLINAVLGSRNRQRNFGDSWGSTLALAYAEAHPTQVKGLILRGIFTLERAELLWFYQGASWLFPDYWEEFLAPIPEVERRDLIGAYYERLTGNNEEEKLRCAKAWSKWEMATGRLFCDDEMVRKVEEDIFALQFARIECHYFFHGGFFKTDDEILKHVDKIAEHNIPCSVVQGRYDIVCPMKSAWDLYRRWPQVQLHVIADGDLTAKETAFCSKLVDFADAFKKL